MQRHVSILLELWRAASEHAELPGFLSAVAPSLRERLPLHGLWLRHVDLASGGAETLAAWLERGRPASTPPEPVEAAAAEALQLWCADAEPLHAPARELGRRLPHLAPVEAAGDLVALPLAAGGGTASWLVASARRGARFENDDVALLRACHEPLAAALGNDLRRREEARLREAAEADREALLSRLGRRDMAEAIVGAESGLRAVMERVRLVAPRDVPVLILGETGSGKEVVARAIHTRSNRAAGPFHRVNCGAIPAGLIDSELFGHERGSFTGATGERRGWFERANGGTLFLDEIGELPLDAQVRLLRVLQDGVLERVGGQRPISVDVRIVAATHRDLQALIAERRFREDLWYRIAVFPLHLPALRERPEDIPALATHVALRAATRFGLPPLVPSPQDLELLIGYAWPGNVRELGAVMERAVILGDGRQLEVARALGVDGARPDVAASPLGAAAPRAGAREPRLLTLDEAMAQHIGEALVRCRGRIEGPHGAAATLGINPHTLRARMRKLGVDWARYREEAR